MVLYIISIVILLIIILMCYSYLKIDISRYNIENKKIDKDLKILQLSDLHNRNITDNLLEIIDKEKPDIIIISGDMVDSKTLEYNHFFELIKKLKDIKVYYTFGNHEHCMNSGELDEYYKELLKTNINILNDSKINISRNIRLYGIDFDIETYERKNQEKKALNYLNNTFNEIDNNKYNILIAHNPLWAKVYDKKGFDLTLSGHVHGGIIRLPFLGGLLSPEFKFFPEYYEGIQKYKKMDLIVSRGLGFCKYLRFRLFNPAEVVIINLVKSK